MKKILAILMAIAMVFSFAACGTKKDGRRLLGSECGRPFSENASGRSIRLMIAREAAR